MPTVVPPYRVRYAALAASILLAVACGGSSTGSGTPTGPRASVTASVAPSSAQPSSVATGSPAQPSPTPATLATGAPSLAPPSIDGPAYDNPVFTLDFPDPHVILVGDTYYAYSTNASNQNIPIISSNDLATWHRERDGLPALPPWAVLNFGFTWAPGVIQIADDSFVMYFVARYEEADLQCIGVATATAPIGPFTSGDSDPFVCQTDIGGSIDPYPFSDADGKLYLYWKNDGNCCAKPVELWVQQLSEDGTKLIGKPTALIARDQPWEIPLIENPAMVESDGDYYLFYSGNRWDTFEYAVGYATCDSVTGPCTKPLNKPVFTYTDDVFGPGGESFFTAADGALVMAYHAWVPPNVGYPQGQRSLFIDPVNFENGAPVMTGPTVDPQPIP
jgi:beta-xylosidase